jgi:hypothetical protein
LCSQRKSELSSMDSGAAEQLQTPTLCLKCLLVAAAAILILSDGCASYRPSFLTGNIASVRVDATRPGLQIPATFLGISHDWGEAEKMMGDPATGTNPIYRKLINNLIAFGADPPIFRVGGAADDLAYLPDPPTTAQTAPLVQLYKDIGAKFYLGVNLANGKVKIATDQAKFFVQHLPADALLAIEIGNEPDDYQFVKTRRTDYTYGEFLAQWQEWQKAINAPGVAPGMKFIGPSFGGVQPWVWGSELGAFLNTNSSTLSLVSQHWYAGSACSGRAIPSDYLLRDSSATGGANAIAPIVSLAHAAGLKIRMAEMNSIACNGQAGVTDTFASALWAIDATFELARTGLDGVNFHMDTDDAYGAFLFNMNTAAKPYAYSINVVRPEYYGLLFFQQAAPAGSKLLPVRLSTSANLKAWATIGRDKAVRVSLLNKDQNTSGEVTIKLEGYGMGTLVWLSAPQYQSKKGVTFGGQTFDGSPDGTAQGEIAYETVLPQAGVYSIQIPRTSAALLTVTPPGAGARISESERRYAAVPASDVLFPSVTSPTACLWPSSVTASGRMIAPSAKR